MPAQRKLTDRQKKQMIVDRAEGMTFQSIGDKYGVTETTVRRVCKADPETSKLVEEKKEQNTLDMLQFMEEQKPKIQQLLKHIVEALDDPAKLARTNPRDLATAYGIIYDKITASAPKTNDEYLQKARDILGNIHGVIE